MVCLADGLKDVERAGADIAVNDAERCDQRERLEPVGVLRPALFCVARQAQLKLQPEKSEAAKGTSVAPDEMYYYKPGSGGEVPGLSGRQTWIGQRCWDKLRTAPRQRAAR
jgi:hypothetical protein